MIKNGVIVCDQRKDDNITLALYLVRVALEFVWAIIRSFFEIGRAFIRWLFPMEPKDVTGELVLITGSGHGMGREMALRFARLGAAVVCVDINPAGNDETYKMIQEEKGKAYKYQCDVTDRAAVMELAQRVRRDAGTDVTILVNNAGIMPCKPLLEQTEQQIRLMNDINVNAHIWTLQAFLPPMMERNHGHVVAMSSMAGLMGLRNLVPYCGSKYAVRGIMHALAVELRDHPRALHGIKLTTVFPYMVNTGFCRNPRIRFQDSMKMVDPADAADMIVNAVRRNIKEISLPKDLYYMNRFVYQPLPFSAASVWDDFFDTGCDPQD